MIVYNTACSDQQQTRVLIHELAHLLMEREETPVDLGLLTICSYSGNPADLRHRIAHKVEKLILG